MRYQKLATAALISAVVAQDTVPTLAQALNSTESLSTLNGLVGQLSPAALAALTGATDVTVLAPNNDAFSSFNATNDTTVLANLLSYHVLIGTYQTFENTSTFIPTSLAAGNSSGATTLTSGQVVEAVNATGNATFYSGFRTNATSVAGPVAFTGGVIYIIDSVLEIPANVSDTAIQLGLSTLAGALTNASLVEAVDTAEQVTIFAPNNEAFQNIGSLFNDGNVTTEQLATILQYHVISGQVLYSTDLSNTTVGTLAANGQVTVQLYDENGETAVYVNNARVIIPDILVANGVVHVIDEVLNPANATATADPSTGSGVPAFDGASESDEPPLTSGVPEPEPTRSGATSAPSPTTNLAWTVAAPTGLGMAVLAGVALVL